MTLYLSRLVLSHFRSHKRADLAVDQRPVALFGPNGAGKTNVLEAVSLFSPGRGMRRASAQDMTRRPEAIGWKVSGDVTCLGRQHEITFQSEAGAARQVRIDDKTATQVKLGEIMRVLWLVPAMDRLWIEGAEGRRRFLDRLTLSLVPSHGTAALTYERAMRDRNRLLKDEVRDAGWYAALERQMARSGAEVSRNRSFALQALAKAQSGAVTAFPAADLTLMHPEGPLPEEEAALQDALAQSRGQDMRAGRTLVGPHRVDLDGVYASKGVPARECSTGEQKALLISLILANARALIADVGAPPIVLLDEVAAHLDPSRRAALYDEICALGVQAWMTGTEAGLFEHLGSRASYIDVQGGEAGSVVQVGG